MRDPGGPVVQSGIMMKPASLSLAVVVGGVGIASLMLACESSSSAPAASAPDAGVAPDGGGVANECPAPTAGPTRIFGLPSGQFVTNTTISQSAGHGIDRGWRDVMKPDYLATNTFTAIANCKQSYPSDLVNPCPGPGSLLCPQ